MCFSTIFQPFPMAEILKLDVSILTSHVVTEKKIAWPVIASHSIWHEPTFGTFHHQACENQVFITCHLFLVIYGYT